MNRLYRKLPEVIQATLLSSEGWLVGSSIVALLHDIPVTDYDIIVPNRELFQITMKQLYGQAEACQINSFGGVKVKMKDGLSIDIWCEELDHFLKTANRVNRIYNMKRNITLINEY